jgi:putative endonuclease
MEKQAAVYILASQYNGTLYIGVTSDLIQRVWQRFNARSNLKSGIDNGK